MYRIHAHYPKRNLSKLGKAEYIYPYLLRDLQVKRPNQVWMEKAGQPTILNIMHKDYSMLEKFKEYYMK